jgi:nitrogen fixation/metabolism regulation signal transduction histidine kinase
MINKNFYINIISRLILIVGSTIISTWFYLSEAQLAWAVFFTILTIIFIVNIIRYFNGVNRWMAFFLLGIENEDTTLKPPPKSGNRAIDDVYRRMMILNDKIKTAKVEMAAQEQYFKKIINQASTGLFSINSNDRIININPAATKLTNLYEYHHINSLRNIDKALPEYLTHIPIEHESAIFENEYGQKLLFKLSEITVYHEKLRLVAVSDITKEMDNGEVDAWIKLVRTLSHEIMNNVAPITTLTQVLAGYFKKEDSMIDPDLVDEKLISNTLRGLNIIEGRSAGLLKFVENYRKFTKLPTPAYKKMHIRELLDNVLTMMSTYEGFDKIKIKNTVHEDAIIRTDDKLLHHVILNIIKNAWESMIESNTQDPVLVITMRFHDNKMYLEISNNGPLIPPEIKEQIFVPFFTTKEDGTGVGLSLSKQIMLKMEGDISVREENDMTHFVISQKL